MAERYRHHSRKRKMDIWRGAECLRGESEPGVYALPWRITEYQAASNQAAVRVRAEHSIPDRPPAVSGCDSRFATRGRRNRPDCRRCNGWLERQTGARCKMGELYRAGRC